MNDQVIFNVDEIAFTYFYLFAEEKSRTVQYPPHYTELDAILRGWEGLVLQTGCYIREWSVTNESFVAALMDQDQHVISCIYVRGHA